MGFFDFLKHFSNKEVEIELEESRLENIGEEIDSWSKKVLVSTTTELESLKKLLSEKKSKAIENSKKLLKAELKNPNIPERAKHIMEGNRKMYIQRVERFLETASLPEDFKELLKFCTSFNDSLDNFAKETTKSYQVLNEFFSSEAGEVVHNIKEINDLIKKSKDLVEKSKILEAELLKNKLGDINQRISLEKELKRRIKQKEDLVTEKKLVVDKEESNLQNLECGEDYKELKVLTDKKKAIVTDREDLEKEFLQEFSIIIPALKKYERMTLNPELVREYLDNSLQVLLSDQELKISELLTNMRNSILNQEMELKDKKKDKILQELKKLDKNYFNNFIERYKWLTAKINSFNQELGSLTITEEIETQRRILKEEQEILDSETNRLNRLVDELGKTSVTKLKENLTREIRRVMNREIKIL